MTRHARDVHAKPQCEFSLQPPLDFSLNCAPRLSGTLTKLLTISLSFTRGNCFPLSRLHGLPASRPGRGIAWARAELPREPGRHDQDRAAIWPFARRGGDPAAHT